MRASNTTHDFYARSERFAAGGSEPRSGRFGDQRFRDIPAVSKIHSSAWDRTENPANDYLPANLPHQKLLRAVELGVTLGWLDSC